MKNISIIIYNGKCHYRNVILELYTRTIVHPCYGGQFYYCSKNLVSAITISIQPTVQCTRNAYKYFVSKSVLDILFTSLDPVGTACLYNPVYTQGVPLLPCPVASGP